MYDRWRNQFGGIKADAALTSWSTTGVRVTAADASRSVRGPSARTSIGSALRADVSGQPTAVVHHQQCDVVLGDVIAEELADECLDDVLAGRVVCDRVE